MACTRCTRTKAIERHHKRRRIDGGGDEEANLEDLCKPCHRYETTRFCIVRDLIADVTQIGQLDRIAVFMKRLLTLDVVNTPERIRLRGSYRSYWEITRHARLPVIVR